MWSVWLVGLGKGEKERYTHLSAETQRRAKREKKTFLSDQCKEIEENNRMGKTRDVFKKCKDIKGIFHAKMGTIKDRNGMDLTEAEVEHFYEDLQDLPEIAQTHVHWGSDVIYPS